MEPVTDALETALSHLYGLTALSRADRTRIRKILAQIDDAVRTMPEANPAQILTLRRP